MDYLYKRYKRRIILSVMLLLVIVLFIMNGVIYTVFRHAIENQFELAGRSMAVAVSKIISEDLDGYRNFLETRDVNSQYYQRMQGYFNKIKDKSNLKFIYTINRLDDTHVEFILDSEPVGSKDYSAPGDIEEIADGTLQVCQTLQPAVLKAADSQFGWLLGGNAPILDEQGELLGVAGVAIDYELVFSTVKQLFFAVVAMFVLLLVLIYFLLSRVAHFLLEPMLKDKLTGAYNKRYFEHLLQENINISLKSNVNLSVFMLDLDMFKNVNDTYGHIFGDVVLSKTASLIRDCLRQDDFFVRYGGEEFIVLLFNNNYSVALKLAERIRKTIESFEIYNEEENISIKTTISIGIANLQKRQMSALELVKEADKALYKAKETRNAVVMLPLL